jgi:hypothetical protein
MFHTKILTRLAALCRTAGRWKRNTETTLISQQIVIDNAEMMALPNWNTPRHLDNQLI